MTLKSKRSVMPALLLALVVATHARARAYDRDPTDLLSRFGSESPYAILPSSLPTEDLIPPGAVETHEMQSANLRCAVGSGGALINCGVDWESTPGIGLCPAARAVADRMRLKDRFPDGEPLEKLYAVVTVWFDVEGSPPYRAFAYVNRLSKAPLGPIGHPLATGDHAPGDDCQR